MNTTVVIGLTGSGKSTFCQCITYPDSVELKEDEGVFDVKEGIVAKFEITASVQYGTK